MHTGTLFLRELRFRPVGFLLGVTAVAAAAACMVGAHGFLAAHDHETERLVTALETRASSRMAQLRDEARESSKSLGFNILLLPDGQDAGRLYADNRSTHFFSAAQVAALSRAKFATLNHLLPMLRHRVTWDAYGGDVILVGVQGEIYIKAPGFQKPMEESIAPGHLHAGDAVRQRLGLEAGATLDLLGSTFVVDRLLPQKGNVDDISLLMNLGDVQRLSGQPDKVGGILALSCNCAVGDLDPIRTELARVIEGVQVVEFTVRARARQRARDTIDQGTRAEMEDIRASRGALREQAAHFAGVLVASVTAGTMLLLVVLTVNSVRERRTEVAMLRALGLGAGGILSLFLYKSIVTGLAGGVLGCLCGALAGRLTAGPDAGAAWAFSGAALGLAILVAVTASVVPAILAARTDPALILNQE